MTNQNDLFLSSLAVRPWAELEAVVAAEDTAKQASAERWRLIQAGWRTQLPQPKPTIKPERGEGEAEDPWRAFYDGVEGIGEKLRFLREHGLEPADVGLPNWIGAALPDPEVQRQQAVFGATRQAYARTWAGWGVSEHLGSRHFRKGYDALALANCCGLVGNAFITVVWSSVGITAPEAVAEAHRRYLELLRKALRHRRCQIAWVWVIENGRKRGLHSHVLAAVPKEKRDWLRFQAEEAVATIAGRPVVKKKGARTVLIVHRRDDDVRAQWALFAYMMKGLRRTKRARNPERAAEQVALEQTAKLRLRRQGLVETQRFGVSRGLNTKNLAKLRAEAEVPVFALERGETRAEHLFTDEYWRDHREWTRPEREAAERAEHERMETELLKTLHI